MKKRTRKLSKAAKELKAKNDRFNKLSKAEKRVAIAKDVLKMLDAGRYIATSGTYVDGDKLVKKDATSKTQLCKVLNLGRGSPGCDVCARGAMFLSAVMKFDNLTIGELGCNSGLDKGHLSIGDDQIEKYERHFFSPKQLELIEGAFEGWGGTARCTGHEFSSAYPEDEDRLRAIMENIIAHKGTFVMPDRKELPGQDDDGNDTVDLDELLIGSADGDIL